MYVLMCVRVHEWFKECMLPCTVHECKNACVHECMNECIYACIYVSMYVCDKFLLREVQVSYCECRHLCMNISTYTFMYMWMYLSICPSIYETNSYDVRSMCFAVNVWKSDGECLRMAVSNCLLCMWIVNVCKWLFQTVMFVHVNRECLRKAVSNCLLCMWNVNVCEWLFQTVVCACESWMFANIHCEDFVQMRIDCLRIFTIVALQVVYVCRKVVYIYIYIYIKVVYTCIKVEK